MGRWQEQCLLRASWLRLRLCRPCILDPHRIVAQDRRRDYGEDRYRLLGMIDGRAYVIVYTMRGPTIRIISARKANGKEVGNYEHNARQD